MHQPSSAITERNLMSIEKTLEDLNITLPDAPAPIANFVPCKRVGSLVFVSGQGPILNGKQIHTGKLGADVSIEEGYDAARICGLNLLSQLKAFLGSLDQIKSIVHIKGYVACATDFANQPAVINGCSDFLVKVFGEAGKHTRCALGANALPTNIPVEIEMIVEV